MTQQQNHIAHSERILSAPPKIHPVTEGLPRPLWSVMIPAYNCAGYLESTLQSVLLQDPGEDMMQIEVIDDCSTDADVAQLVNDIGKGRVTYYRQPTNVGSLRNFHTCLDRSRGKLIHLLHGDDKVLKGFYHRMQLLFEENPSIGAAYSRYSYIDETGRFMYAHECEMEAPGVLENWLERICERQRIQYAAMVVKREVYEKLGGFYGVEYGEDWEMWVRIAAHYDVGYVPDILAAYRKHATSISGKSFLTGKNMHELAVVMEKIQKHIPESKRKTISMNSRKFYAHYALRIANSIWKDLRHHQGVLAQMKAAWSMNKDFFLFYKILKLYTRITLNL